jgi:transposase
MLPVGKDTLLREIRRGRATNPLAERHRHHEWAWRRRQRYGTLICDLERRGVVDLLPDRDRDREGVARCPPGIRVVARDRAGGYAGPSRGCTAARSRSPIGGT